MRIDSNMLGFVRPGLRKLRARLHFAKSRSYFRRQFRERSLGEAFSEIYRTQAWGKVEGEPFFSGAGSSPEFGATYAEFVNRFVADMSVRQIVDLGCGDFRVGRLLNTSEQVRYIGMDIVPEVVSYHQAHYQNDHVSFRCGNILEDELPDGSLCLVRQVLQHLSNEQIAAVMNRCTRYRYVLVTEDVYTGSGARPNLNKAPGWDTRTYGKSGVFLELPPFNLKAKTVLEIPNPPTQRCERP